MVGDKILEKNSIIAGRPLQNWVLGGLCMYYLDKKVNYHSKEFKALFDAYFPTLCLFAGKILSDSDVAKDVVQEVFVKLLRSDTMFENEKAVRAYLYILTRNDCLDVLKKNKKMHQVMKENEELYAENDFLEDVVREETYRLLDQAIKELGVQSQKVIQLSLNQLTNVEIADELNISINTVKTLKLRAYKRLRGIISRQLMVMILIEFF